MQSLYEWDFHHGEKDANEIADRNLEEFAPELDEKGFAGAFHWTIRSARFRLPAFSGARASAR